MMVILESFHHQLGFVYYPFLFFLAFVAGEKFTRGLLFMRKRRQPLTEGEREDLSRISEMDRLRKRFDSYDSKVRGLKSLGADEPGHPGHAVFVAIARSRDQLQEAVDKSEALHLRREALDLLDEVDAQMTLTRVMQDIEAQQARLKSLAEGAPGGEVSLPEVR